MLGTEGIPTVGIRSDTLVSTEIPTDNSALGRSAEWGLEQGVYRSSELLCMAQPKRLEIPTFELLDWNTGVSLLPPSPPRTCLHFTWGGQTPSLQAKSVSWRQEMHFRVWVKS